MPSLIQPIPVTCPTFISGARGLQICVPGGGCISYQYPGLWADSAEICRGLLGQMQQALAPMAPIFDIVSAVLCLKDIVESVPDAIDSLNPTKVTDALTHCIPKISKLIQLVPQISAPIMVCQVLEVMECVINGFITEMQLFQQKQVEIEALAARAAGPTDPLFNIVECAGRLNQNRFCMLNESLGPINSIIQLINIFLELLGLDPIPLVGEMAADATNAIDQLRVLVSTLKTVRLALGCGPMVNVPRC